MCRRALKIGLPALAFTEHLDLTGWVIDPEDLLDYLRPLVGGNGPLIPEPLDLDAVPRARQLSVISVILPDHLPALEESP